MQKCRSMTLKWKLSFSIYLPVWTYFSNWDKHKLNKFMMAVFNSLHELHGFCIYIKQGPSTNNIWISFYNLSAKIPSPLKRQTSISKCCQFFRQKHMLNLNPSLPLVTPLLLTSLYSISFIFESLLLFSKHIFFI